MLPRCFRSSQALTACGQRGLIGCIRRQVELESKERRDYNTTDTTDQSIQLYS